MAEFKVVGGGVFEKHVEIMIPHSVRAGKVDGVRVLQGSENNFEVNKTHVYFKRIRETE